MLRVLSPSSSPSSSSKSIAGFFSGFSSRPTRTRGTTSSARLPPPSTACFPINCSIDSRLSDSHCRRHPLSSPPPSSSSSPRPSRSIPAHCHRGKASTADGILMLCSRRCVCFLALALTTALDDDLVSFSLPLGLAALAFEVEEADGNAPMVAGRSCRMSSDELTMYSAGLAAWSVDHVTVASVTAGVDALCRRACLCFSDGVG